VIPGRSPGSRLPVGGGDMSARMSFPDIIITPPSMSYRPATTGAAELATSSVLAPYLLIVACAFALLLAVGLATLIGSVRQSGRYLISPRTLGAYEHRITQVPAHLVARLPGRRPSPQVEGFRSGGEPATVDLRDAETVLTSPTGSS